MSELNSTVPAGECHCGCGQRTQLAEQSRTARGWIKGEPKRFVKGHLAQLRRKRSLEREASGVQRCKKCGETKLLTEFHNDRSQPFGKSYACKPCQIKRRQRYKAENPEKIKEYERRYRKENAQLLRDKAQAYAERNPEERKAMFKAYYYENKEQMAERYREYVIANREKIRVRDRRRRATVAGSEGDHTDEEVLQMAVDQDGLCAYCENPLGAKVHVDHMLPLSRGGRNDWTNLAITCPSCNLRKNAKTVEEFIECLRLEVNL